MPLAPFRTFANNRLQPVFNPAFADTDAVKLMPGSYSPGQVLGQANFGLTPANDVQTLTITGTPTGGSIRLAISGSYQDISTPIGYNLTAAAVQAILEAMPSIGTGNVACTGGPLPGTAVVITFQGAAKFTPMPVFAVFSSALTGGTTPAAAVAHTTTGKSAGGIWLPYSDAASDGSDVAKMLLEFPTVVNLWGQHLTGAAEPQRSRDLSAPAFYKGYFRTCDLTGLDAAAIADLGKIVQGSASYLSDPGTILRIG
jgi:hypothetical protein